MFRYDNMVIIIVIIRNRPEPSVAIEWMPLLLDTFGGPVFKLRSWARLSWIIFYGYLQDLQANTLTLKPVMPGPHLPIPSPILYLEITQIFDAKLYKTFTTITTHFNDSFHELAIAVVRCFYCYAMLSNASPLLH